MAKFGESRVVLPTIGIDIWRLQGATITEGVLVLIGAETYPIIGEPMGDTLGLIAACEAVTV